MIIESISKGFSTYINSFTRFTLFIFPLVIIFGLLSSLSNNLLLSESTRNLGISLLLLNNFLIVPFLTIFSVLLANDLSENINRESLGYYLVSIRYILRVFLLSIISTLMIGIGIFLFIIPGIYFAGMLIFVNFFVILRNEPILEALQNSFKIGHQNIGPSIGIALFFWFTTFTTLFLISYFISDEGNLSNVPFVVSFISNCFLVYIQIVLISFPILMLYKKLIT